MTPDREPVVSRARPRTPSRPRTPAVSGAPPRTPDPTPAWTPAAGHASSRVRPAARVASASVAALLALALILGACGSSTPTPTPGETPGPGRTLAPGETAGPGDSGAPLETPAPGESSAPPEVTPTPGIIVGPGETPSDTPPPDYEEETPPPHPTTKPKPTPTLTPNAALEKKLPNSIRGVKLVKDSYSGTNMSGTSAATIATKDLLARLGKKPANLSIATAADPTGKLPVFLQAIRIAKVPTEPLLTNYLAVIEKYSQRGIEKDTASLGGKKVTTIVDIEQRDAGSKAVLYIYAKGDIVYVVSTNDKALAADALKAMP